MFKVIPPVVLALVVAPLLATPTHADTWECRKVDVPRVPPYNVLLCPPRG